MCWFKGICVRRLVEVFSFKHFIDFLNFKLFIPLKYIDDYEPHRNEKWYNSCSQVEADKPLRAIKEFEESGADIATDESVARRYAEDSHIDVITFFST